ncbi:MFS transporter [Paenibacillus methanolicus]|uniref:Putative MFS family arabinose efflux permease n=1 Tax=Paenibacillus methanolicus TaxID=582686 RepID=A0A5S5CLU2_9BACL|nr:MFS transporter [Paenibacillus methanolicus]TYP79817.1 putative MFS family arabinose efflux permease [Paenibacillus methanolicus]
MNDGISKRGGERAVVMVGAVSGLALFGDAMLYVVLPIYWKEAGLDSLWQVGLVLSINRFVRLPLNPLIGWLYNRLPLRAGLYAAVLLAALTTAGYGIWKGFAAWLVLRALWGIAWSLLRIGGYLTVIRYSDRTNRGRLMGRYNGVWRLGSLVGVLFGGILVPAAGLQPVAILFGVLALAGLPLVALYIGRGSADDANPPPKAAGDRTTIRIWTRPVKKIVACGLLMATLHAIFGSALSYLIASKFSQGELILGIVISSTVLAGMLEAIRCLWEPFLGSWFGRLSDGPAGRTPLLLLSAAAAALGFALVPLELPPLAWLLIVLYVKATGTMMTTIVDAMAADVAKSSAVAIMTAYSVATDLGAAVGPVVIYWALGREFGLLPAFLACSGLFLLIGWSYRTEYRMERRGEEWAER